METPSEQSQLERFGDIARTLRVVGHETLDTLGRRAGINPSRLCRIEKAHAPPPTPVEIEKLRAALPQLDAILKTPALPESSTAIEPTPAPPATAPDILADFPALGKIPDVVRKLGCSRNTVHAFISRGALKTVRLGRLLRVSRDDLRSFIANGGSR